jgi:uncharacterized protein YcbK (DUF882 family)
MTTVTSTRMRLSPHFVIEEFDGHDPAHTRVPQAAIPAVEELCIHLLEPLREKFGACTVTSGFRTVAHNIHEHGAPNSQHIYVNSPASVAADVVFAGGSLAQWAAAAREIVGTHSHWTSGHRGGVGTNDRNGHMHVDSGPRRDFVE